ncbi:L10-interacting MYB domain-containing protein-like [Cucumis melo]|uniref:L10-interacting MYB domain-containing protein-like n=1 Tax=Cucumis melo TaxID=3656 RepID=A0ABM3KNJ4_CUCME|nr:L10-interacting MYB domain-containing protein-like [Cucumis melo]
MSQKSTEQLCVDDVVEIDELKGEGPWSNKSETLFVDLMDEEVAKGNRPTTTFTKTSWNYMRSQLIASAGYNYSHDQLKNKFNKLRQMYKDFKKILSDMTGNGWDPLLGTINLEEEQWNELFKVNKRAKKFRKSGCPHYEKLVRIFGDTTATGVNACPSTRLISDSEDENENDVASNTNDCIGAIDGTHVAASIPQNEQIPFRGRKTNTTWNIMCVCSFDMLFTYFMSGWEGSANDSRILQECIKNPENKFPMPKRDQYYLVNSGYSNMSGFLAPFRGQRYHL